MHYSADERGQLQLIVDTYSMQLYEAIKSVNPEVLKGTSIFCFVELPSPTEDDATNVRVIVSTNMTPPEVVHNLAYFCTELVGGLVPSRQLPLTNERKM